MTSLFVEWGDSSSGWARSAPFLVVVAVGAVAFLMPVGVVIAVSGLAAALIVGRVRALHAFWNSRAVTVFGVALFASVTAWGVLSIVVDIVSMVLGRYIDAPPTL